MSEYWPKEQLDRITPPQARDARGSAYLQALNEIIGDQPITAFQVKDAETCPAEALPALIAEYSMQEFIDPGLPEAIQRQILKNAWLLQSLEG
ncbi:phage tail protein, partial [Ruegeria sp. HKCCD8929]|uniref:phage tail protein n=1 Tax=Ruegeria sp. HKCCD8929 TaxID=2683006 RepID=UPI001C2C1898